MAFEASAREWLGVTVVHASGKLTLGAGGTALRDTLHVLAQKGHKKFLVNMAGVDFIDSFGIGELVRSYATVRKQGGELKLVHVTQKVHDLLQITRIHTLFEIYTDEQIALGGFR